MNQATVELLDVLTDYYDDSDLQPAIKQGDKRHRAIVAHRNGLGRRLPPDEARLMRRLLDLSRSRKTAERRASQEVAEEWAKLLESNYGEPKGIPSETLDRLTPSQVACAEALTDEPQRTHITGRAAKLKDPSTARKALRALATMNPPLAKKTPSGYVRVRPK